MNLNQMLGLLNGDLQNEYQHMLFYMHAANMLTGLGRLYLGDKLKEHAASEMQHVFQFAHKIRGWGGVPVSGLTATKFVENRTTVREVIDAAVDLERAVVANYHARHKQAVDLYEHTGKHMDIVLFLEEQIEHSQGDIDELVQLQGEWNQ